MLHAILYDIFHGLRLPVTESSMDVRNARGVRRLKVTILHLL